MHVSTNWENVSLQPLTSQSQMEDTMIWFQRTVTGETWKICIYQNFLAHNSHLCVFISAWISANVVDQGGNKRLRASCRLSYVADELKGYGLLKPRLGPGMLFSKTGETLDLPLRCFVCRYSTLILERETLHCLSGLVRWKFMVW